MLLVVALHALVFYACWQSLARTHHATHVGDIEYTPVPTPRSAPFQPQAGVDLNRIDVRIPTPPVETLIAREYTTAPRVADTAPSTDAGAGGTALAPPPTVQRVTGGPATGFPAVDDFYPAAAIRANEAGSTTVQVCVNARGWLDAEPVMVHSSDSAKLDAAALKLAAAGSGHYRATTENGVAVPSCFTYAVRFQIKNVR